MPKVRKGNRVLTVSEAGVSNYLKLGYDLIDEKGDVKKQATGGKTVTVAEHNKVLADLKDAKEENTQLTEQASKLEAENKKLKADLKKLQEGKKDDKPKEDNKQDDNKKE